MSRLFALGVIFLGLLSSSYAFLPETPPLTKSKPGSENGSPSGVSLGSNESPQPSEPPAVGAHSLLELMEAMKKQLATIENGMATMRNDMATKEDLATMRNDMATMRNDMATMRKDMATKEDLATMRNDMATMRNDMATKEDLKEINKRLVTLEKRTGLLVEDKARSMARRKYGDDFSEQFQIKSIHDIIKLISKANHDKIPSDSSKVDDRFTAANMLADFVKPFVYSFVKSAAKAVLKQSQDAAFDDDLFREGKDEIKVAVSKIEDRRSLDDVVESSFGKIIGAVQTLSKTKETRKMMEGRFKRKLERIKRSILDNKKLALTNCEGPGILFFCALSYYVFEKHKDSEGALDEDDVKRWIEDECDIFDFKEEVECDLQPIVELVEAHATIQCGEIKSSIQNNGAFNKATNQMAEQARMIEFALSILFEEKPFTTITKKGHLFVYEHLSGDPRTNPQVNGGISVFVHEVI